MHLIKFHVCLFLFFVASTPSTSVSTSGSKSTTVTAPTDQQVLKMLAAGGSIMHPSAVNQPATGPTQTSPPTNQSIASSAPTLVSTIQVSEPYSANQLVIDSTRVTRASNQITICEPNLPPPIQAQSITVETYNPGVESYQQGDVILAREPHTGSLVLETEPKEGNPQQVDDVIVEEITEDGQRRRLITLKVGKGSTVFSSIEAPGAKEMVWGASIFRTEAPNLKINMVKKDSKKSCVFSLKTHT